MSAFGTLYDQTLAVLTAANTVPVVDGPEMSDAPRKSFVAVGWNGAEAEPGIPEDGVVGQLDMPWMDIGGFHRTDDDSLTCAVVAWSGGRKFSPARATCLSLYTTCTEALVTAFRTSASALNTTFYDLVITAGAFSQTNESDGVRVRLEFTVTSKARI